MALKRHHKVMIGSFSTIIVIYMIVSGILLYVLLVNQQINYSMLSQKIEELTKDTQSKINGLSSELIQLQSTVSESNKELTLLKASVGEDFSGIIEDSIKSVVTIVTDVSQGTGFIITDDGYIVTNAHILSGASEVRTITSEGSSKVASFIGYDEKLDIALLDIEGEYSELSLGNSNDIQIGEKVIAIGNPLGLQFSVSQGIVSGIDRTGINDLDYYIQTDAALNPGNSGGPLINKEGKVIGINNFKIGGGESLGFALESNYLKKAINEISIAAYNQTLV